MRTSRILLAVAGGAVLLAGCGTSKPTASGTTPGTHSTLVVASAGFTESNLVADMYALVLQHHGYTVQMKTAASSEVLDPSLESGAIDIVPEYAATYADVLQTEETKTTNPNAGVSSLSQTMSTLQSLAAKVHLKALNPASAVDQNAFAVRKSYATQHKLATLSDLGAAKLPVKIAGPSECATRHFCALGLESVYGIHVTGIDPLGFDTVGGKKAAQEGTDQVAEVATTDATVGSFGLVVLTDDKHLQEADNLVPIVYQPALTAQIEALLNSVSNVLTTSDLATLDMKVDVDRESATSVAQAYLTSKGLI